MTSAHSNPHLQKSPRLSLMFCGCHLEFLVFCSWASILEVKFMGQWYICEQGRHWQQNSQWAQAEDTQPGHWATNLAITVQGAMRPLRQQAWNLGPTGSCDSVSSWGSHGHGNEKEDEGMAVPEASITSTCPYGMCTDILCIIKLRDLNPRIVHYPKASLQW